MFVLFWLSAFLLTFDQIATAYGVLWLHQPEGNPLMRWLFGLFGVVPVLIVTGILKGIFLLSLVHPRLLHPTAAGPQSLRLWAFTAISTVYFLGSFLPWMLIFLNHWFWHLP